LLALSFSDVLFVRAARIDVRQLAQHPYQVIYGSAGIGKSTLLQLLLLRELVKGVPVLLHLRGVNSLLQMVDNEHWSIKVAKLEVWLSRKDLPPKKDVFVCFDSPAGLST
jgi:hypothetical protein